MPNVRLVPIERVIVPTNRQRKYHDPSAHQELVSSIRDSEGGLQNAPVVREEDSVLLLVSGERRLRALSEIYELGGVARYLGQPLPEGLVPVVTFESLDSLAAEEAELDENTKRLDLTWQERSETIARLMALRQRQASAMGLPAPTVADVAEEVRGSRLGSSQEATRREIIVAKHLDNPVIKDAKSVDEAFKILRRVEQQESNVRKSASIAQTYGKHNLNLVRGDCLEWLASQPDAFVDVVLTDPPYGIGADEFNDSGLSAEGLGGHFYEDSFDSWALLMDKLWPQLARVTKPESHLYMFCDIDRFPLLKGYATLAGFKTFRTPLIWLKPGGMRAPWPQQGPQRKYETILFCVKGSKPVNFLRGDTISAVADSNLGHPAQKPVDLYRELLCRSALAGETVLDPFCGSGPIFPAAKHLSLTAYGVEQEPAAHGIAAQRIEDLLK